MQKTIVLFLFFGFLLFPFFVLAADLVEINTASLEQLDIITGIGPVLGQRIIDARPFSSVDDLLRVKGIGEKTLQKIKDQGLAYVQEQNNQTQNPPPAPAPSPQEQNSTTQNTQNEEKTETTNQTTNTKNSTSNNTPNTPAQTNIETNQASNIIYPEGVFINEILPNPDGADETNEWIELYNSNNFEVDLSGWKINDTMGTITNYTFSKNTRISSNGFLLLKRTETKITLNNDEDKLDFFTPAEKNIDSATYTSAPLNQSYNKTSSSLPAQAGWQWSTTLTPGAANTITASAKSLPESKKSVKNNTDTGLASLSSNIDINQEGILSAQAGKTTNPWFLFFIAIGTAIISAVIVLFIKFKLNKNNVRT